MNGKSKLTQIQSTVETLKMHFGDSDETLERELNKLLELIEYENNLRSDLMNKLSGVVAKM